MKKATLLTLVLAASLTLSSALGVAAADTDETVTDNKITFEAGGGTVTPPVDPEDPDQPVTPDDKQKPTGNAGALRLDVVPVFDFGTNQITTGSRTFYGVLPKDTTAVADMAYYVQVTDVSGTKNGWTLSAKMTKQFTGTADPTEVLSGASIALSNVATDSNTGVIPPSVVKDGVLEYDAVNDTTIKLASAQSGEGLGITAVRFGDVADTAATSVALTVPSTASIYADTYKATIQWTLQAVPTDNAGM